MEPHPAHAKSGWIFEKRAPNLRGGRQRDGDGDIVMDSDADDLEGTCYRPFNSQLDWKIAQWAVKDSASHAAFDRFLEIPGVRVNLVPCQYLADLGAQVKERLNLSYHNVRSLHQAVDGLPERAGPWKTQTLSFPDRPQDTFTIRYRDPVEAIKTLWKDPLNSGDMVFSPQKLYRDSSKDTRIYSEMHTGKWWNVVQVRPI